MKERVTMSASIEDVVRLLKTIADETRLRILGIVAAGPVTGKDLAERLDLTPATISHHARKLVDAGVLIATTDAQRVWYSLNNDLLLEARRAQMQPIAPAQHRLPGDSDDNATFRSKVLQDFFNGDRLKSIPAQRKRRVIVLQHIVERFDAARTYPERELNDLLRPVHEDVATIRRELVDYGFMTRERGIYSVARDGPLRSRHVAQEITGSESEWRKSVLAGVIGPVIEASGFSEKA
jgi:DNA-binding transcriptional ArsR family regulator